MMNLHYMPSLEIIKIYRILKGGETVENRYYEYKQCNNYYTKKQY